MSNNVRFSEKDRGLIRELTIDLQGRPYFEVLKSCLIWHDERPTWISVRGQELLGDLWATRGFMHRGLPEREWGLGPEYFKEVWAYALEDVPDWPGFRRIEISGPDRQYLEDSLREVERVTDY